MITQKRGKNVAIAGTVGQLLLAGVVMTIWLWTNSLAAMTCTVFILCGLPLWLIAVLLFYCRQLERKEAIEFEQLAAQGAAAATIFKSDDGVDVRPAAARVAFVERWIVPIFTLCWAGLQITGGAFMVRYLLTQNVHLIANPAQGALLLFVAGFPAFLFSRYAGGMSKEARWRLLRATGSYLLVNFIAILACIAAFGAIWFEYLEVDLVLAYVAPLLQLVLAAELLLNFVLDLYRPRMPGQEQRPSFDSRLFNLAAEPGKVGHSIAETLNYQFGFEVSKTWFYELIARAFLPLLVFGVVVMMAMSSLVVVRDDETVVVLHWGQFEGRVLEPGLSFKWPWPIDKTKRFETGRTHEIILGGGDEHAHKEKDPAKAGPIEVLLWTEEHGHSADSDFLVAMPTETVAAGVANGKQKQAPPVGMIELVVPIRYMVTDVLKYGFQSRDSKKLLECEAYRQMLGYFSSATLDSPVPAGQKDHRPEAIMTYGRAEAAEQLKQRIQAAADKLDMGVKITFVGISAAHPPSAVAKEFERVPEEMRRIDEKTYQAQAQANQILVSVAGDPDLALRLANGISVLEQLRDMERRGKEVAQLDAELTAAVGGEKTAIQLNQAQALSGLEHDIEATVRETLDKISAVEQEIERAKLLGEFHSGDFKQQRLGEHHEYLALLRSIAKSPVGFDYASRIETYALKVDKLFDAGTVGMPAVMVEMARAMRWQRELSEQARYEAFQRKLLAYRASPRVYSYDRWIDVWDQVLPDAHKYVIGVDRDMLEIYLDWSSETEALEGAFEQLEEQYQR